MASSIKRTIRLERAQRKLDKTIYPSDPTEKEIIKLIEQSDQCEKDIQATWKIMYSKGYKAGRDNQNPAFFDDFDFINLMMKSKEKYRKKIDNRLKKINKTEEELLLNQYQRNVRRGATSF